MQTTLNYQSIPPYYLRDRFSLLAKGLPDKQSRETQRLKYLADYLNAKGTPVEDWKLPLACARRSVAGGASQVCVAAQ